MSPAESAQRSRTRLGIALLAVGVLLVGLFIAMKVADHRGSGSSSDERGEQALIGLTYGQQDGSGLPAAGRHKACKAMLATHSDITTSVGRFEYMSGCEAVASDE